MKTGIDITSCYSIDSLYGPDNQKDLLCDICLATVIDEMIFSDSLVYPVPSKKLFSPVDDPNYPTFLRTAQRDYGLLKDYQQMSAEEYHIDEECYHQQFENFKLTVEKNIRAIKSLSELHFKNDKIVSQNRDWVSLKLFEGFNLDSKINDFSKEVNIPNDRVRYLFDVFLRTIRYDFILSQDDYDSSFHPFRNRAYLDDTAGIISQDVYSIGYYLSQEVKRNPKKYPISKILDLTSSVKSAVTSGRFSRNSLKVENGEQPFLELLSDADEFPVPLKNNIKNALVTLTGLEASVIGGLISPIIGVIVAVPAAGIYFSSGKVPSKRIQIYRRFIDYDKFKKTV